MDKPQPPRKPIALSQPIAPLRPGTIEAQRDGSGIIDSSVEKTKPRLPPRPPTWQTAERNAPQPTKRSATATYASTNLLDETDPAIDQWKPLLPHR